MKIQHSEPDASLLDVLPATINHGGVTLHIDVDEEDCWLEVDLDHCDITLARLVALAEEAGFELMGDDECEPTINADGSVRTYLAEVSP